jgi:hypothetical protein
MKLKTIGLSVFALVLLAGAAFVAGRWMQSSGAASPLNFFGDADGVALPIERTPSAELPMRDPDVNGAVTRVVDNSLFIGVDNVTFTITYNEGGASEHHASYTGAEVEVLATKDTRIYCDTNWQEAFRGPRDQRSLQQEVSPCTLEDIEVDGGYISVWGVRRGDRIAAEILLYMGF